MTIDGLLTALTLIVALLALASPVARYRLQLHGWVLWLPSLVAFILVVYLELFDSLKQPCLSRWCTGLVLSPPGTIDAKQAAFLIAVIWLIYFALITRRTTASPRRLPILGRLIERFELERRYGDLVTVVEPHIDLIMRTARREGSFQKFVDRVKTHGVRNPWLDGIRPQADEKPIGWRQRLKDSAASAALYSFKPIIRLLPHEDKAERSATAILKRLYINDSIVRYISVERPMFALKMMLARQGYDYDFSDRAFHHMIADRGSRLCLETIHNQGLGLCFYNIDPDNQIIFALFDDATVAEQLEVYRPIGNYPLELLEENTDNYREVISAPKPRKDEKVWFDPTYITIRFFDIMIRSSMRDGIQWHMWLFYMNLLVDKLTRHMSVEHPDYNPNAEFPTFAHYLIYEIFSSYGGWIGAVECCEEDSPAVQIHNTNPNHENGSILKSTLLSVGQSMAHLVQSPKIDDRFIIYVLEMVMRNLRDLRAKPNGEIIAEALTKSLLARGVYGRADGYGARLRRCYAGMDHIIRFDTEEFGKALEDAYP